MKAICTLTMVFLMVVTAVWAATPPILINYQGVLRDSSGAPRNGSFDMVFRFYDDQITGTLLLTDSHTIATGGQVTVSNGLFNVTLGGGTVTAGSETTLEGVFKNHDTVYLDITVGGEQLTPRVKVLSEAYAQNCHALDGLEASGFALSNHVQTAATGGTGIDTSSTAPGSMLYTNATGTWTTLSPGSNGQVLQLTSGLPQWSPVSGDADAIIGNEVVDATNATLTRTGSGTAVSPYTLGLNLGSANTWSGSQTFSAATNFPGSGIWNSSGKVGIKTLSPTCNLNVVGDFEVSGTFAESIDQQQTNPSMAQNDISPWQSFTAGYSGKLTKLDLNGRSPLGSGASVACTLRIYAGTGTGSTPLLTQSVNFASTGFSWYSITLTPQLDLAFGSVYTFSVSTTSCDWGWLSGNTGNPYANGICSRGGTWDLAFRTYMVPMGPSLYVGASTYVGIGTRSPVYRLQLTEDSAAKPSTNTWTIASDLRLKKNIRPFVDGLDVLEQINPIRYQYNGLAGLPKDTEGIGVVAQEIQAAAPYTVGTFRAKLNEEAEEETELYDFNSHALTFILINSVKELDKRTQELIPPKTPSEKRDRVGVLMRDADVGGSGKQVSIAQSTDVPAALSGRSPGAARYPVCEAVEVGDVLVTDTARPGIFCRGRVENDPGVFGIVNDVPAPVTNPPAENAAMPVVFTVSVATSGVAYCKVDAGWDPIRVNDLLVTSPTPGFAMKALPTLVNGVPIYASGTVIGKALEPFEAGTGMIKVLVMLR